MARGEVTGRKPVVTADPTKRKPGPPIADPGAVEPAAHIEPQRSASATKPPIRGPPLAMSIREFCTAHRISEDMFFKMRRQGWGPTVMRVGTRTLISIEAAAEWRKAREQEAEHRNRLAAAIAKPASDAAPPTADDGLDIPEYLRRTAP